MASSSKVRQKAPSHSGGSRPARRARSTIHSLAEGDSRYTQSKRRSDSRTDSNAAAAYNVSMRRKSRGTRENDDDATPEADQDHGNDHRSNRSQRKRQKAQLRTQSPDEDLCRSSSSDYSSSSDSVQRQSAGTVPNIRLPSSQARREAVAGTANIRSKSKEYVSKDKERPESRPALQSTPNSRAVVALDSDSESSDEAPSTMKSVAMKPAPARSSVPRKRRAPTPSDTDSSSASAPPAKKTTLDRRGYQRLRAQPGLPERLDSEAKSRSPVQSRGRRTTTRLQPEVVITSSNHRPSTSATLSTNKATRPSATNSNARRSSEGVTTVDTDREGTLEEDEDFNTSIARFEVHIQEIVGEEEDSADNRVALSVVSEGIVEEIEESFWEDEAELYIVEQLLRRHRRRLSRRTSAQQPQGMEEATTSQARGSLLDRLVQHQPSATAQPSEESPQQQALQDDTAVTSRQRQLPTFVRSPTSDAQLSRQMEPLGGTGELSPELVGEDVARDSVKTRQSKQQSSSRPFEPVSPDQRIAVAVPQTPHQRDHEDVHIDSNSQMDAPATTPLERPQDAQDLVNVRLAPMAAPSGERDHVKGALSRTVDPIAHAASEDDQHGYLASRAVSSEQQHIRELCTAYVQNEVSHEGLPARKPRNYVPPSPHDTASREFSQETILNKQQKGENAVQDALQMLPPQVQDIEVPDIETVEGVGQDYSVSMTVGTILGDIASHINEPNDTVEERLSNIPEGLHGSGVIASIQLTSPVRTPADLVTAIDTASQTIDAGVQALAEEAESVFSNTTLPVEIEHTTVGPVAVEVNEASHTQTGIKQAALDAMTTSDASQEMPSSGEHSPETEPPSEHGVRSGSNVSDGDAIMQDANKNVSISSGSLDTSLTSGDNDSSDESNDAEGESFADDRETPFKLAELLSWADSLKDKEKPHLITAAGWKKLFEQIKLSNEGALPLLLAWKLDNRTKAECLTADFIGLARENQIDSPAKLATYLTSLQSATLAISSHLRFPSSIEGDANIEPIRTWRIPEIYRSFYSFSFDYLRDSLEGQSISQEQARNLWQMILAPYLSPAQDIVDFLESSTWKGDISKAAWLAIPDVCALGDLWAAEAKDAIPDAAQEFVHAFREWLAREDISSVPGNPRTNTTVAAEEL